MTRWRNICVVIGVVAFCALLFGQYYWLWELYAGNRKQAEISVSNAVKTALPMEYMHQIHTFQQSYRERVESIPRYAVGANRADRTIRVLRDTLPDIIKTYDTEEEFDKFQEVVAGAYHLHGIDLHEVDSISRALLSNQGLALSYVLEQRGDLNHLLATTEKPGQNTKEMEMIATYPLGIAGEHYLAIWMDTSFLGVFEGKETLLLVSLGIALLLCCCVLFLILTIDSQTKIAQLRDELISSMVHEINNPIVYLKRVLLLLQEKNPTEEAIEKALGKIKNMSLMTEKLLTSSSKNGVLQIIPKAFNIKKYIEEAISSYTSSGSQHQIIRFNFDTPNEIIIADELHLGNAIRNLIDNSIKYSPTKPEILINCYDMSGCLHVSIADKGIGIPRIYHQAIFEKGFRMPRRQGMAEYMQRGFGLGLSYVKMVATAHNGNIRVNSNVGEGSEFTLIIPIIR